MWDMVMKHHGLVRQIARVQAQKLKVDAGDYANDLMEYCAVRAHKFDASLHREGGEKAERNWIRWQGRALSQRYVRQRREYPTDYAPECMSAPDNPEVSLTLSRLLLSPAGKEYWAMAQGLTLREMRELGIDPAYASFLREHARETCDV